MTDPSSGVVKRLRALDRAQQQRPWLAFTVAVFKKFGDDGAGQLAGLIAYYAFFAMFPLLLVMVAVLGLVLQGDSHLQHRILDSSVTQFPIIGPAIKRQLGKLTGNGPALAIGLAGSIGAGLGLTQAIRTAFDRVWQVEHSANFLTARLRGLALLGILGLFAIVSTVLAGLVDAGAPNGTIASIGLLVLSAVLTFGLFVAGFSLLTSYRARLGELIPGAIMATIGWVLLQHAGGWLVNRELRHASEIAGYFGTVLGLLFWISLGAQLTLLAAEVNVVRARHLWPRELL